MLPNRFSTVRVRIRVLLLAFFLTVLGTSIFWSVVHADASIDWWEWGSLPLLILLFGWISFSFAMACEGFGAELRGVLNHRRNDGLEGSTKDSTVQSQTAILMPVYNESPERVMAAVAAMREQLMHALKDSCNAGLKFDFFILSDSTRPEIWLQEEWIWSRLAERSGRAEAPADPDSESIGVFYRHRSENTSRKAGNIADFCEKWGSHYDHMIILDADSLMTGSTMVEMVHRMNNDRQIGILQVPPVPIGRRSLFARLQQFAAAMYGPVFARGYAEFSGDDGNYWGHNAILRLRPFMRHCHLPILEGKPPLGGEILSHDFVEAALMVRNRWKVVLATDLSGSYEECPTTLLDYAQRDHRWCQGNLQHWRLMLATNMHPMSRLHFFSGILAYVGSPLWILFMMLTLVSLLLVNHDYASAPVKASWLPEAITPALSLFLASMGLLLFPKIAAVVIALIDVPRRRSMGGTWAIISSAMVESLLSILLAPIIAIYHTRFVLAVLSGNNVKWNSQQRDEHGVSWSEAFWQFKSMTLIGFLLAIVLALIDVALLIWFSPLLLGLCLSIPIAVAMGSQAVGMWLHRIRLLDIAQELQVEPIVSRHQHWITVTESIMQELGGESLTRRLQRDNVFRQRHLAILTSAGNARPIRPEEPEWQDRQNSTADLTSLAPATLRRLLCDDQWIQSRT